MIARVISVALAAALVTACAAAGGSPGRATPSAQPTIDAATNPPAPAPPDPSPAVVADFPLIEGASLLVRSDRESAPAVSNEEVASLARANADFALDLYRELAAANDENLVLGPHSISTAMAMIYAGARGNTATEMAGVLHFDRVSGEIPAVFNSLDLTFASRSEEGAVDLRLANQAFSAPWLTLLDSYLTTLSRDFGAPMAELDFLNPEFARQVINGWAADRTNGRITDLFPPNTITTDTVLVVVNAVALDAQWQYPFDPAQTRDAPFHLGGGTVVRVPTMHFDEHLPLHVGDGFAAVELPYGEGDLSMVVIVPDDLAAFEAGLDRKRLERIFDGIAEQGIHLSLPKFAFKSHTALDETLRDLGLTTLYGRNVDLSGMTGEKGLFLQTVQHEAFIEVDEEGTEAHAATGGAMAGSHGPTISVDRPFFFVIRDRPTGAILFIGRVTDPRP